MTTPTMVQVSDLHLEFGTKLDIDTFPEATYLALCGDIGVGMAHRDFIEKLIASGKYEKIFMTTGNHEYYNKTVESVDIKWRKFAEENSDKFVFLDGTTIYEHGDFIFAGCTLWSDLSDIVSANMATYYMNDYRMIKSVQSHNPQLDNWSELVNSFNLQDPTTWAMGSPATRTDYVDGNFAKPPVISAQLTTFWFKQNVDYLEYAAHEAEKAGKRLIVLTHHTPHRRCLSEKHSGNVLDAAYHSDLEFLFPRVYLWGCGHTHNRMDETINGCRIVMNGRGYVSNGGSTQELPNFTPKAITLN